MKEEKIGLCSKQDYQNLLLKLLNPLLEKFSEGCARIQIEGAGAGYARDIIEMEAFARPLWGLVPFWAGGGKDAVFSKRYRKGIAAGTDPDHAEYWGICDDCDQRFVEMAPIAYGLLMTPQILWTPLTGREKDNLVVWLLQINEHELPKCNWYFFRILVNLALKKLGRSYNAGLMASDLEYINSCYLGDGWYVDGVSEQKDYYCAFAMQFYSLIYVMYAGDEDRKQCERFKERAAEFAGDFIYWFDERGAALPYGRSLVYRFAQSAFWPAAAAAGVKPLDFGVVRGIIRRNLEYWIAKPIFLGDGSLSVGYAYPNLCMAERYNAPGSPYWCMKLFLMLALPKEHSFWTVEEKELPKLEPVHEIPKANMLIQRRRKNVTAYVSAEYSKNVLGHFTEKYAKFAYSTEFGFSVSHSLEQLNEAAPDSMLVFIPDGEERVYVKKRSSSYKIEMNRVSFSWSLAEGVDVETELIPVADGHLRRHRITSNRRGKLFDCGFSVARYVEGDEVLWECGQEENSLTVKNNIHGCKIVSVLGGMKPYLIEAAPNTNLLYKNTRIPALWCSLKPGEFLIENQVETWVNE